MPDAAIAHSSLHESASFTDELLDWIDRSPFLAIALLIHAIAFFTLNMFPWEVFEKQEAPVLRASAVQVYEDQFEELVEVEPVPIDPVPVATPEIEQPPVPQSDLESEQDTEFHSESPFDNPFDSLMNANADLGLGGGAGSGG
ncbi:MAG: hypothetical protein ACYS26_02790, partial [Planctomycetota bacterium]